MDGALASASTGVMNSLLAKLSAMVEGEYELLGVTKSDIAFLRNELSSMNALLQKLAAAEKLDVQVQVWRDNIRELTYDIEDCIDMFMQKLNHGDAARAGNFVEKIIGKVKKLWSGFQMANQIHELKARVVEESERRLRYKYDESISTAGKVEIDPRLPALYVEAEKLVGIDGPMQNLMDWLMKDDSTQQLRVVSIVGFGGLGKTTLANQVYRKIKSQFDCTAFVPVSQSPIIKKILRDLLTELGSSKTRASEDDERQLINNVRAYLQDKRYLIIVDDIWSTIAWEFVKSALPENKLRSRIITTTRHSDVARSCCSSYEGYIHNIQPLSNQDSSMLFYNRVFQRQTSCPPHLEEVSLSIIKRCHGLPLAINTVAGLLANRSNDIDQWEQVRDSMVSGLHSQLVRDILLLSYYDLPHHLKSCFLYLCIFPEDCNIAREKLIWRWIAEGFITNEIGQTLDQTGENYFNDLINRSLIQPIDIMYDGMARSCRLHDTVLDLIISLSTEQNFVTVVEGEVFKCSADKIRRLSLLSSFLENDVLQEIMNKCSQVRSLIRFHVANKEAPHLPIFHSLRVLVLRCTCANLGISNHHIKSIGSSLQLKYLEIGCHSITELPETIGGLQYLQTLDIHGSKIDKLPPTIGNLKNLVRLLVDFNIELPDQIGNLQSLRMLSHAYSSGSVKFLEQLRRLTNLRVLHIRLHGSSELGDHGMWKYQEALESSLTVLGKHGLQSLEIDTNDYSTSRLMDLLCCNATFLRKLCNQSYLSRIPQGMQCLVNLAHLDIRVTCIKQEDLCILGAIPNLLYAILTSLEAPTERLSIGSQQFCYLKEFIFRSYGEDGLRMVAEQEAMPRLRSLGLNFRAKETESKTGFEFNFVHLANLEHITATIDCYMATRSRVEAAEAAIRNTANIHPGHPTLQIERFREYSTVEDEDRREMVLAVEDSTTCDKEVQQKHSRKRKCCEGLLPY
ncbi:disease resistance protein RGA5-like [Miscanthus floridulus]|uniref:disease resistance protein RGA5-like n=1 Tax=Miscanthus floridulus TaxID=154761 RepID=UPI00345ADDB6